VTFGDSLIGDKKLRQLFLIRKFTSGPILARKSRFYDDENEDFIWKVGTNLKQIIVAPSISELWETARNEKKKTL